MAIVSIPLIPAGSFTVEIPPPQFTALAAEVLGDTSAMEIGMDVDAQILASELTVGPSNAAGLAALLDELAGLGEVDAAGGAAPLGAVLDHDTAVLDGSLDSSFANIETPVLDVSDIQALANLPASAGVNPSLPPPFDPAAEWIPVYDGEGNIVDWTR